MAKNQSLSLLPNRLNGVCGQVKCCVKYENEVYTEKRAALPKEGALIQTANGDRGRVYRLHVLAGRFEMLTDQGRKRRYAAGQFDPEAALPEDWSFPRELPSIIDETQDLVA